MGDAFAAFGGVGDRGLTRAPKKITTRGKYRISRRRDRIARHQGQKIVSDGMAERGGPGRGGWAAEAKRMDAHCGQEGGVGGGLFQRRRGGGGQRLERKARAASSCAASWGDKPVSAACMSMMQGEASGSGRTRLREQGGGGR
jgi:hypothetical protein